MQVREVMMAKVRTVEPGTRISEIARVMRDEGIGAVPVVENDKLIGMVTDRDIVVRALAGGSGADMKIATSASSAWFLSAT